MLEKSKEIKFGKIPGRSRKQSGTTPTNKGLIQRTRKGGVDAYKMPNGTVALKGTAAYMGADTAYVNQTKKRDEWKAYKNRSSSEIASDNATTSSAAAKAADKANKPESTDATANAKQQKDLVVPAKQNPESKLNTKNNLAAGEKAKKLAADKRAKENATEKARIAKIPDNPADKDKNPNAPTYSDKEGKPVSNLKDRRSTSENKETKPVVKSSSYADAKKKDSKLDSYIKIRNNSKKGSPEYTRAQNKINSSYGKGPQRKVVENAVGAKKKAPISVKNSEPSKDLATKAFSKKVTKAVKKSPSSSSGPSGGLAGLEAEKNKLKSLGITTETDRELPSSKRNVRQNKRVAVRAERKSTRNKIREIKGKPAKASYGMSKKYGKGGRKRAQIGAVAGAGLGVAKSLIGNIGKGKGLGEVAKEAAVGGLKGGVSTIPGVGGAIAGAIPTGAPAAPVDPNAPAPVPGAAPGPATGADPNVPVAPAGPPAPGAAPVDPNAPAVARKGKMVDRRKKKRKGGRK